MLRWRLVSAAIILSLLLGLLHLDFHYPLGAPGIWLLPLILVATLLIAGEMLNLWRDRPDRPARWPVVCGSLVIILATCTPMFTGHRGRGVSAARQPDAVFPDRASGTLANGLPAKPPPRRFSGSPRLGPLDWTWLGYALALGLIVIGEMARYGGPGHATTAVALALLAVTYAGVLPSFLVQLRLFHDARWGMGALVSLILVVKASDTGAYFTGRALGRHKLAPTLSPGKTIEGVIGGLVAAVGAAMLCYCWMIPRLLHCDVAGGRGWRWAVYGAIIMGVGVVGDLTESLFKRDASRKDSSHWLPGLGGVLDIFDSILFAAPIAYFCWAFGLIGPV